MPQKTKKMQNSKNIPSVLGDKLRSSCRHRVKRNARKKSNVVS